MIQGADGELVIDVKTPEALNFLVKKLDAIGVLMGKRKNVDDPPSYRKFSGLGDEVDPIKTIFKKCFVNKIQTYDIARFDG